MLCFPFLNCFFPELTDLCRELPRETTLPTYALWITLLVVLHYDSCLCFAQDLQSFLFDSAKQLICFFSLLREMSGSLTYKSEQCLTQAVISSHSLGWVLHLFSTAVFCQWEQDVVCFLNILGYFSTFHTLALK